MERESADGRLVCAVAGAGSGIAAERSALDAQWCDERSQCACRASVPAGGIVCGWPADGPRRKSGGGTHVAASADSPRRLGARTRRRWPLRACGLPAVSAAGRRQVGRGPGWLCAFADAGRVALDAAAAARLRPLGVEFRLCRRALVEPALQPAEPLAASPVAHHQRLLRAAHAAARSCLNEPLVRRHAARAATVAAARASPAAGHLAAAAVVALEPEPAALVALASEHEQAEPAATRTAATRLALRYSGSCLHTTRVCIRNCTTVLVHVFLGLPEQRPQQTLSGQEVSPVFNNVRVHFLVNSSK